MARDLNIKFPDGRLVPDMRVDAEGVPMVVQDIWYRYSDMMFIVRYFTGEWAEWTAESLVEDLDMFAARPTPIQWDMAEYKASVCRYPKLLHSPSQDRKERYERRAFALKIKRAARRRWKEKRGMKISEDRTGSTS